MASRRAAVLSSLVMGLGWGSGFAYAQAPSDLTMLSLEELMNIQVTSVSKHEERLFNAPAAVYVLTADDIRRSGATTIGEALRMVPGVHVGRINSSMWAISARGFNEEFANSILVLVDGRSIYSYSIAGVRWEMHEMVLEDIERIEVVRGAGGALWGANAVNGVINIITKHAKDTQGWLLSGGYGTEEHGFGTMRYGGRWRQVSFRADSQYAKRDSFVDAIGDGTDDGWWITRSGFRADWEAGTDDTVMFQGNLFNGEAGLNTTADFFTAPLRRTFVHDRDLNGWHLLTHWDHTVSDRSSWSLKLYYDHIDRADLMLGQVQNTADLDFKHRYPIGERQDITWGVGYRFNLQHTSGAADFRIEPPDRNDELYSFFVQDEITLIRDRLRFTLGSKFEHNEFSGFEFQPSGRLAWTPTPRQTIWTSLGRAVRTPDRVEQGGRITLFTVPGPTATTLVGSEEFVPEEVLAYELGYRVQPAPTVSVDLASFYNWWNHVESNDTTNQASFTETFEGVTHTVRPRWFDNNQEGEAHGVELAAKWQVFDPWKVALIYTWLDMQMDEIHNDIIDDTVEDETPHTIIHAQSFLELPYRCQLDTFLSFVDGNTATAGFFRLAFRLGWRPSDALEVSIFADNLLDDRHQEFPAGGSVEGTEVQRSVYGKITYRF